MPFQTQIPKETINSMQSIYEGQISLLQNEKLELERKVRDLQEKLGEIREYTLGNMSPSLLKTERDINLIPTGTVYDFTTDESQGGERHTPSTYGTPKMDQLMQEKLEQYQGIVQEQQGTIKMLQQRLEVAECTEDCKPQAKIYELEAKIRELEAHAAVREELIDDLVESTNKIKKESNDVLLDANLLRYLIKYIANTCKGKTDRLAAHTFNEVSKCILEFSENQQAGKDTIVGAQEILDTLKALQKDIQTYCDAHSIMIDKYKCVMEDNKTLIQIIDVLSKYLTRENSVLELYKMKKLIDNRLLGFLARGHAYEEDEQVSPIVKFKGAIHSLIMMNRRAQEKAEREDAPPDIRTVVNLYRHSQSSEEFIKNLSMLSTPASVPQDVTEMLDALCTGDGILRHEMISVLGRVSVGPYKE